MRRGESCSQLRHPERALEDLRGSGGMPRGCCVALAVPSPTGEPAVHVVDGVMRGRVIRELRGAGGFGYDVLFCADGHDVTTAQLPPGEKDAISHRGKALREIAPVVAAALGA